MAILEQNSDATDAGPKRMRALLRQANAAEVPAKYRGLWCDAPDGTYYRCRKATSEAYQSIGRNRIKVSEEDSCPIATVTPTTKFKDDQDSCAGRLRSQMLGVHQ